MHMMRLWTKSDWFHKIVYNIGGIIMEIRYDLQNNKEAELIKIIDTVTNESSLDSSLLFEDFKKNCINITAPEEAPL